MEKSVRDIGIESPPTGSRGWTLVGKVADNPRISAETKASDDFVFAVPTMPPLRLYRRRVSMPPLMTAVDSQVAARDSSSEHLAHQSADPIDNSVGHGESSGSSTTPSPTTHDLMLVAADYINTESNEVAQNSLAPIVDSEDSGEEFGIV